MDYQSVFSKKDWAKYALIVFLLFSAVSRLVQLVQQFETTKGIDFRNVYLGASIMLEGKNPYDDVLFKQTWKAIVEKERFEDRVNAAPGLPRIPLLYQPYALPLFMPMTALPYSWAMPIWIGMCVCFVMVVCIGMLRMSNYSWVDQIIIILFLAGSTLLRPLILVGQPTALFLLTGFLSLFFYKKGNTALMTLFLFITCFKITFALPFVVFYMIRFQWKSLFKVAFMLIAIHGLLFLTGFDLINLYKGNIELLRQYRLIHLDMPGIVKQYLDDTRYSTELLIIPQYYFRGFYKIAPLIMLPLFGLVSLAVFLQDRKEKMNDIKLFLILAIASLIFFYHLYYDQVLILPLLFLLPSRLRFNDLFLVLFLGAMFFPIHGIFERIDHYSVLWLFKPVVLLCLMYWVWRSKETGDISKVN